MIGVDFGGTRIKVAQVEGGKLLREVSAATPVGATPEQVLDLVAELVKSLAPEPDAFGMAIPGEVDEDGRCYRLPNVPGFEGYPIAEGLSRRTGARVAVENDGTSAALGEALFGHGQKYPSFVMVTLGTGVGGGVVIGRRLIRGAHGFGGEIGHVTVNAAPDAPPCVCGNRGCIEAYAGSYAVLAAFRTLGGTAAEMKDVTDAARRDDPAAVQVLARMAEALGIGLNSIQNVLDLDAIVFTGGVSNAFDLVEPGVRATMRQRRFAAPLSEVPLLVSELGDRAGVVGAAHLTESSAAGRPGSARDG